MHSLKCKRKFLSRDVSDQFIFLAVVCLQLENVISMAQLRFTFAVIALVLSFCNNVALAVCPLISAAFALEESKVCLKNCLCAVSVSRVPKSDIIFKKV